MEGTSFSLLGMLATMNWVAKGVVLVLALMSIWSLTIAIERLWRFQRAKRESLEIARAVTPLLAQHKLRDAINLASDKRYRHSHLGRVLRAGTDVVAGSAKNCSCSKPTSPWQTSAGTETTTGPGRPEVLIA